MAAKPNATGAKLVGAARKRDRGATQARLFDAATSVMSALGYDAATTKRIAETAGVNEQLISRYFGGKEGLLVAILRSHITSEYQREKIARASTAVSLQDEIAAFLREADFAQEQERFARLALGRALVDPQMAEVLKDMRTDCYARLLGERLREHRERGAIRTDADLALTVDALVHLRFGLAAYGRLLFGLGSRHLNAMIESIAAVIAHGLAKPARRVRPRASAAVV
jgi:AcrR family transcriptional regulator